MEIDRRVGVAVDFSACSKKALKWALDNVVRDGDHLILVIVRPEGSYEDGERQLWATSGSRNSLSLSLSLSVCLFLCFKSLESYDE
jgi:nucleotide-binding universal stress UspA family protein